MREGHLCSLTGELGGQGGHRRKQIQCGGRELRQLH